MTWSIEIRLLRHLLQQYRHGTSFWSTLYILLLFYFLAAVKLYLIQVNSSADQSLISLHSIRSLLRSFMLCEIICGIWKEQNRNQILKYSKWTKRSKLTILTLKQRKNTSANSAAPHSMHLPGWKDTFEFTVVRSLLFVRSADTLALKLALLEATCEPIQEKSILVANSATTPAQQLVISGNTRALIQGKNRLIAPSVPLPSHKGSPSNSTCRHIQGRSVLVVISATIHATVLIISRDTYGSILEKNPLRAISATSLAAIQAVWGGTDFPTLMRNPLHARNANTFANGLVIWGGTWKSIHPRQQQHATDFFLWYWPCFAINLAFWQKKGQFDYTYNFTWLTWFRLFTLLTLLILFRLRWRHTWKNNTSNSRPNVGKNL